MSRCILFKCSYHNLKPEIKAKKRIQCVHHGAAGTDRNLEEIIICAGNASDVCELHLYLISHSTSYYERLKIIAEKYINIYFHDPFPYSQIIKELNRYDIGVFLLKPIKIQYKHALPNKMFDFVQARLGLVVSPQPEMKKFVEKHGVGVVTKGYSSKDFTQAIKALTKEDIKKFKQKSDELAKLYCAENYREDFLKLLEEIQK